MFGREVGVDIGFRMVVGLYVDFWADLVLAGSEVGG